MGAQVLSKEVRRLTRRLSDWKICGRMTRLHATAPEPVTSDHKLHSGNCGVRLQPSLLFVESKAHSGANQLLSHYGILFKLARRFAHVQEQAGERKSTFKLKWQCAFLILAIRASATLSGL